MVVLGGVKIDYGSIFAVGAVVTKSIPQNQICAGIPAREIARRLYS